MRLDVMKVALFSGLLLLGAGYARAADRVELAKMHEQMLAPVVQLEHNCSGTVIYSGPVKKADPKAAADLFKNVTLILTAQHCVSDVLGTFIVNVPVYQRGRVVQEQAFKAKVRSTDHRADLALVELIDDRTVFSNIVTLGPAEALPLEGADVWTVGYSLGLIRTLTDGHFGGREWLEFQGKEREYFRASSAIAGGNSGGVLFQKNDAGAYEQIGVTVLGIPRIDFMGWYVPADQIHDYLKRAAPELQPAAKPKLTGGGGV